MQILGPPDPAGALWTSWTCYVAPLFFLGTSKARETSLSGRAHPQTSPSFHNTVLCYLLESLRIRRDLSCLARDVRSSLQKAPALQLFFTWSSTRF